VCVCVCVSVMECVLCSEHGVETSVLRKVGMCCSIVKKLTVDFPETVACSTDCIQRAESIFNEACYGKASAAHAAAHGNACCLIFSSR